MVALFVSNAEATAFEDIQIRGETNFNKSSTASLKTNVTAWTSVPLFEPSHAGWQLVLTSVISPEIDHFQNEIRVNVFTVLGVHF